MKLDKFKDYYTALYYMADCAINDRRAYIDAMMTDDYKRAKYMDPVVHKEVTEIIEDTQGDIKDFIKIREYAKSKM